MKSPDLIPNLIDKEPVVAMGCTAREVKYAFYVAMIVTLIIGLLVALIGRSLFVGVIGGVISAFISFIIALNLFAYVHRHHEPGYYIARFQIWLENNGLGSAPFEHADNYYRSTR